jgi:hypothetical protein
MNCNSSYQLSGQGSHGNILLQGRHSKVVGQRTESPEGQRSGVLHNRSLGSQSFGKYGRVVLVVGLL